MQRRVTGPAGARGEQAAALRRYYGERDHAASPEGVMKLLSVVLCVVLSVMLFSAGCAGCAGGAGAAGAALVLAGACCVAALSAARMLQLALYAPMAYFITDVVVSAAVGAALLVTAALGLTLCAPLSATDYIHGPLAIATAGLVTGSSVVTFVSVTRHWDAARRPPPPAPRRPPPELEV